MSWLRAIAFAAVVIIFIAAICAGSFAPADYATQFREEPNSPPSARFLLGTDDLGRDRLSRVLYATRVSILLAPAAALLTTALAALIGALAGYFGGITEKLTMGAVDVFLSLPWLFLLITVRAMLPLNVSPLISIVVTFLLLGLLGWAAAARVVCAGVRSIQGSAFMLNARAMGCSTRRLIAVQLIPNMRPVLWAQFLVSIPVFILAEANLSMLGLGVAEPLPSLGGLMAELQNFSSVAVQPWRLVPLGVLAVCVSSLQIVRATSEVKG